ncbi:hypothetical protein QBC47DRAFT_459729 [Echria macrotheca]|uniref:Uncharacterized protein n=1 Tax=Echria macrotheca TaxID=438768 RepID=A0AAJ0F7P7_9PEZI|nr:hypothetical protein QBC47DRAFT_459729 [Echria macrotheca]
MGKPWHIPSGADGSATSVIYYSAPTSRGTSPDKLASEQRLRAFDLVEFLRKFWILELLWCLVGLGSAAAIIAVLAQYDGQKPPEWPLGITLNTFLAFLASVSKASLLIPVTEGLGQLRWIWFSRKARKADDFGLFEEATRGSFGSLRLLLSLKGGVLGFVAALVIVTSLMLSTVTQATIQYKNELFPSNHTVQVPRITVFSSDQFFLDKTDQTYLRSLNLKQHISNGAYTPASQTVASDSLDCTTGDCEFPDFVTVGICSNVSDVSSHVKSNRLPPRTWDLPGLPYNMTWSATLPWGQNLTIPTVYAFDFWATRDFAPTLAFKSLENQSFADFFLIYSNVLGLDTPEPTVEFRAVELVWYWCTKSYSVSVKGGQTSWHETSRSIKVLKDTTTAVNVVRNPAFWLCTFQISPKRCEEYTWGNLTLAPPPGSEDHAPLIVDELTSLGVSSYLSLSFWDGVTPPMTSASTTIGTSEGMFRALGRRFYRIQGDLSMAFAVNMWRDLAGSVDPDTQVPILRNLTENIGLGLENFIRSDWKVHPFTAGPINGTVLTPTSFVIIRWQWLSYLLAELLLSSVFLIAIVSYTTASGAQPLKSSTLAILCALDDKTRSSLGHIGDYEELRRNAANTEIILEDGPTGLALKRKP